MCLIIYKKGNAASFTSDMMKTSVSRNSDAAGVMYVENGRVVTDKIIGGNTITDIQRLAEWCQNYYNTKDDIIIHHRMSTDGKDTLDNCHPCKVLSIDDGDSIDLYLMHNGIISECTTGRDSEISDTRKYIEEYLRPILKVNNSLIHIPAFREHVAKFISTSNKFVLLTNDGTTYIINESAGKWLGEKDSQCWISNTYSTSNPHLTPWAGSYGTYTPPKKNDYQPFTAPSSTSNVHIYRPQTPTTYGNVARKYDYDDYEDDWWQDNLDPDVWAGMDSEDMIDYLLEIGFPRKQVSALVETLTKYDIVTLIESLLYRIYSRDYS